MNWENTYQPSFLWTWRVFQLKLLHTRVASNDVLLKKPKMKHTLVLFALVPQRHFFGIVDQLRLSGIMFRSGPLKINLDFTNLNISPISTALCLGSIDNISNLLLHHFLALLIARHTIYIVVNYEIPFLWYKCTLSRSYTPWKLRNRLPLIIIT